MTAGTRPEGFPEFLSEIREASILAVQSIERYDDRVYIPALIMALVSTARLLAEENEIPFSDMVCMITEGMQALSNDYLREESRYGN